VCDRPDEDAPAALITLRKGGLSCWKIEKKKRFEGAPRGGLRAGDALYDSQRFSRVKLTGFPFV
jgi:hypothetical protein